MAPTSPAPVSAMIARYGDRYRWLLLFAVMVGTISSILPATSVNVAIPAISSAFNLGQERAQWITSAFMVASTMSMLTTPWFLSRFGYRLTYVGAMILLIFGAIAGGLADTFVVLLISRVAEGAANGLIQPIPAIIIKNAFPAEQQGRAGGIFGMGVVLAPAVAPALGGYLVDFLGWRSTFFMVVPPTLVALWLAYRYVPTSGPGGTATGSQHGHLDGVGLVLGTLATLSLLNALVAFHHDHTEAAVLLGIAILGIFGFVFWQRRLLQQGKPPLMDLRLFGHRQFVMGCIVAFIYGTALYGSTYLLPIFVQLGLQMSASMAGNMLLPAGIVLALTIPIAGRLADRLPTHWLVCSGMLLLALSFALMVLAEPGMGMWWLAGFVAVGRMGLGFILPSLNLGAMRPLPKPLIPQGASTISFLRMLGGAMGVGLCGIVLQWRLAVYADQPNVSVEAGRIAAFHESFAMLTGLCLLAFLAATQLRSPAKPLDSTRV